jgi:hypothetical protein|tara:strand:- start:55 stop:591 length:537 start_codon:yes stop_codon:yes gene_type:complete
MTDTKVDQYYVKTGNVFFEDGEWWYSRPGKKHRERIGGHAKKNLTRMFVNGKYIPKSHPLHKPGRYKSLDDAWTHQQINSVPAGEVYAIINKAWPDWVKVGCAAVTEDRLNGYQTGSPFRDYEMVTTIESSNRHKAERLMHRTVEQYAEERRGEWFKIGVDKIVELFNLYDDQYINNQ